VEHRLASLDDDRTEAVHPAHVVDAVHEGGCSGRGDGGVNARRRERRLARRGASYPPLWLGDAARARRR
jgi:hypothetical protein